ncbi:MAG: hydroxymethylbilane synthase [Pseudobdellovibrio sp.]|nr:hydroxymethylbilane synthase [Pseudobdellovibrio sp.]
MKVRISARQSELAQLQAHQVGAALKESNPHLEIEFLFRESLGDKNLTDPLWKMPEKGVFTEDFYQDLVEGRTDMVVHSWKDLPTEEKPHTFIAASLKRADQRDLLLMKRASAQKKSLKLFSSSPRRAHNLTEFLKVALPSHPQELHFESVRGNIQTRVRKWLEDAHVDGLILAKAAFDRLLNGEVEATKMFLRKVLADELWMVLPLEYNPNAAAQGALAVEINRNRQDLIQLLNTINDSQSFESAEAERNILRAFGGGCHLALGMAKLKRPYGEIEIVKGLTPSGEKVEIKKFTATNPVPAELVRKRMEFKAERTTLTPVDHKGLNALYIAKAEAWNVAAGFKGLIWVSGNETWKKVAARGVWVNGSNESLGESEDTRVAHFFNETLYWGRLSHDQASAWGNKKHLSGYGIKLTAKPFDVPREKCAFVWMSPLEYDVAYQQYPQIKDHFHICGPGRTYEALAQRLGSEKNLFVDILSYT